MKERLYISWDYLIEVGRELLMEAFLKKGHRDLDLITVLTGWLDALLFNYGGDYEIIIEGSDFRTYRVLNYEDICDFVERYSEDLNYDNELIIEELLNQNQY